jgi:hypothetical protein
VESTSYAAIFGCVEQRYLFKIDHYRREGLDGGRAACDLVCGSINPPLGKRPNTKIRRRDQDAQGTSALRILTGAFSIGARSGDRIMTNLEKLNLNKLNLEEIAAVAAGNAMYVCLGDGANEEHMQATHERGRQTIFDAIVKARVAHPPMTYKQKMRLHEVALHGAISNIQGGDHGEMGSTVEGLIGVTDDEMVTCLQGWLKEAQQRQVGPGRGEQR